MIYEQYFALKQRPFSIAPNPSFLYACGQYQEALAALEYGMLHRGGFVLLTGEVGTGKTTLCKYLLQEVPQDTELALILHPQLDRLELLQLICKEFGVNVSDSDKESQLIDRLTEFLLEVYSKGGYSVLIIDEAQHLDASVLELVRLLTNLETHEDKLLQIILLGQPELRDRLNRHDLRQLNQRFTARYHLNGLTLFETKHYVQHRVEVAGGHQSLFSFASVCALHRLTNGIPRLINVLADRCLMGCYAEQKKQVSVKMVYKAAKEVLSSSNQARSFVNFLKYPVVMAALLVGGFFLNQEFQFYKFNLSSEQAYENYSEQNSNDTRKALGELSPDNPCVSYDCWYGQLPSQVIKHSSAVGQFWLSGSWYDIQSTPLKPGVSYQVAINGIASQYQNTIIKPFESHELIPWVKEQMKHLSVDTSNDNAFSGWQVIAPSGDTVNSDNVYDVVLHEQVMSFQERYNLMVDGVLGPQTLVSLILLNGADKVVAE